MNDDIISNLAFWLMVITIVTSIGNTIGILIWRDQTAVELEGSSHYNKKYQYRPWPWRAHLTVVFLAASAWLWTPWVALGLVKAYQANWNAVNHINRPDTVLPVPGKTYKADAEVKP